MNQQQKQILMIAALLIGLAVCLGAFGAHGLETMVAAKYLKTFNTGVKYQFYHGFALLFLALIPSHLPQLNISTVAVSFFIGILLFSFNCYLYALTQIKIFAMLVPIGGVLFIFGWFILAHKIYKELK